MQQSPCSPQIGPQSRTRGYSIDYVASRPIRPIRKNTEQYPDQVSLCYSESLPAFMVTRAYLNPINSSSIKLYYTKLTPTASKKGTVCIIHGYGETSEEFLGLAQQLARNNYVVNLLDLRGSGCSDGYPMNVKAFHILTDVLTLITRCCQTRLPTYLICHQLGWLYVCGLLKLITYLPLAGVVAMNPILDLPTRIEDSFKSRAFTNLASCMISDIMLNTGLEGQLFAIARKRQETIEGEEELNNFSKEQNITSERVMMKAHASRQTQVDSKDQIAYKPLRVKTHQENQGPQPKLFRLFPKNKSNEVTGDETDLNSGGISPIYKAANILPYLKKTEKIEQKPIPVHQNTTESKNKWQTQLFPNDAFASSQTEKSLISVRMRSEIRELAQYCLETKKQFKYPLLVVIDSQTLEKRKALWKLQQEAKSGNYQKASQSRNIMSPLSNSQLFEAVLGIAVESVDQSMVEIGELQYGLGLSQILYNPVRELDDFGMQDFSLEGTVLNKSERNGQNLHSIKIINSTSKYCCLLGKWFQDHNETTWKPVDNLRLSEKEWSKSWLWKCLSKNQQKRLLLVIALLKPYKWLFIIGLLVKLLGIFALSIYHRKRLVANFMSWTQR